VIVVADRAVAETLAPVIVGDVSVVDETLVPVKAPPVKVGELIVVADTERAETLVVANIIPKSAKDETPVPPFETETVSWLVNSPKAEGVVSSYKNFTGILSTTASSSF